MPSDFLRRANQTHCASSSLENARLPRTNSAARQSRITLFPDRRKGWLGGGEALDRLPVGASGKRSAGDGLRVLPFFTP